MDLTTAPNGNTSVVCWLSAMLVSGEKGSGKDKFPEEHKISDDFWVQCLYQVLCSRNSFGFSISRNLAQSFSGPEFQSAQSIPYQLIYMFLYVGFTMFVW